MCVRVYDIEFIVFTDCESWTRLITTNPVSMEAGEYELTRGTWVFARRLEVVASPGCCGFSGVFWVGRIFRAFHEFAFPNSFVDPEQPASNR